MSALNRVDQIRHHRIHADSRSYTGANQPDVTAATLTFIFHNAREYEALYPDDGAQGGRFYAPRVEDGYELEAIRAGLEAMITA